MTTEDRLAAIEEKLDRLVTALERFAPLLDRIQPGKVFPFKFGGTPTHGKPRH